MVEFLTTTKVTALSKTSALASRSRSGHRRRTYAVWAWTSPTTITMAGLTSCNRPGEPALRSLPEQRRWLVSAMPAKPQELDRYAGPLRLGSRFLDFDNDGRKDLLIAQGHDLIPSNWIIPICINREPMLLARIPATGLWMFQLNRVASSVKLGFTWEWLLATWITTAGSTRL